MCRVTFVRAAIVATLAFALVGSALAGEGRQNRREVRQDRKERGDDRRDVGKLESLREAYRQAADAGHSALQLSIETEVVRFAGFEVAEGSREARRDAAELGRSRREQRRSRRDARREGEVTRELRDDRRDKRDDRRDLRRTLRENDGFADVAAEFHALRGEMDATSVSRKLDLLDEMVKLELRELRRDRREHREDRRERREDRD